MRRPLTVTALLAASSCVYFNAMYDTRQRFELAEESRREGRIGEASVMYDSVISWGGRIVAEHPESEHAAPAALLKARAEIAQEMWTSAAATAAGVGELTDEPSLLAAAAGIEGVARRGLGDLEAADRLLSAALAGDVSADDRALFHFQRGLARLEANDPQLAVEDLEAVGAQEELDRQVRLDLARGLSDVGQYGRAVDLTGQLIRDSRFATFDDAMDPHLDSLVRRAPVALDSALAEQLRDSSLPPTKQAFLHYYRGLSRETAGDADGAIASYDSARAAASQGRYAAEARYRWARLRIMRAERPSDIIATRDPLLSAGGIPEPDVAEDAQLLTERVAEFANLVEAYETRGATAAEAALRAAEIAGAYLGARRVARGLYLRYLALAPQSPWQAKAIAGAMLHADWPAGDWAADAGAETDARLRERLAGLPRTDPYRISLQELPRDDGIDSAYVEAERLLRRRLVEIRMLYDTTAALIERPDTLREDAADTPEPEDDGDDGRPEI